MQAPAEPDNAGSILREQENENPDTGAQGNRDHRLQPRLRMKYKLTQWRISTDEFCTRPPRPIFLHFHAVLGKI